MNSLVNEMQALLAPGVDFVLATVVSRNGSAPRTAGAQMIVHADGSIVDTIGGGLLEANVLQMAKKVFADRRCRLERFEFSGQDAAAMDMICGGQQEVLVEYVAADNPYMLALCAETAQCIRTRCKAWWVTALPSEAADFYPGFRHCLVQAEQVWVDSAAHVEARAQRVQEGLTNASLEDGAAVLLDGEWLDLSGVRSPQVVRTAVGRYLVDPVVVNGTVYIFGAGHVSQKLALVTNMIGFQTVVIDDRPEWANVERFPMADEVVVPAAMAGVFETLPINDQSYLIIVTRGHLQDKVVLEQALRTPAAYIGMIGSRRKRELIYAELESQGVPRSRLEQVHSPIGIPIEADSPEEIAVSIAAELIQVRARRAAGKA
jgi:xanthine dehydrogenase accessory factor